MKTYGYARCSTNEDKQDINRQIRELKAAGADLQLESSNGVQISQTNHMI